MRLKDLTGQTFGKWRVLSYAGKSQWECQCECGAKNTVDGNDLRIKRSQGCSKCRGYTHRGTRTRLYKIWQSMKARCYVKKATGYYRYGGRGISVCEEWKRSFEAFRAWANGNGYREALTIERIDNDGNYEPGNCRWATVEEQVQNRANTQRVLFNGELVPVSALARKHGINRNTLASRLDMGWSLDDALSRPVKRKRGDLDRGKVIIREARKT